MNKTRSTTREPPQRRRKTLRLPGFDYTAGRGYFVTICAQDRGCRFGEVISAEMHPNPAGEMVDRWWRSLASRFSGLRLDEWQVMPNHVHGILFLPGRDAGLQPAAFRNGREHRPHPTRKHQPIGLEKAAPPALPNVVGWFKSMTTNAYIRGVKADGWPAFRRRVWQRDYHDRIIRSEAELQRIRRYIVDNPLQWHLDSENPEAGRKG